MELTELLDYIPPSSLDYSEWVTVGMALKHEGYSCGVWDSWSMADSRYKRGDCERKWNTFQEGTSSIVTGGTIYDMACRFGYVPRETTVFGWNDTIEYDGDKIVKDVAWLDTSSAIEEPRNWSPIDELRRYLQALYEPTDVIGYVMQSVRDEEKNKYIPANRGVFTRTAGELLEAIKKSKTDAGPDEQLRRILGDYDVKGGAWIRFNPLDGKGVGNVNVAKFKYALVESDTMELEKQKALIEELQIPVKLLVASGGKSLHAIVNVDALTEREYKERVDYLYSVCEKNGLKIDKQNKNPSRLSRLPGVIRGGKKQFIVAENFGKADFLEWQNYIEDSIDTLPDIVNFADIAQNLPELAPELVSGILRQGHKMIISGASKAGKSFLLIELAISIANGLKWLGHDCRKGKVLYVNLEVDSASFVHRIADVANKMEIAIADNLEVWNLRGENASIEKLAPRLVRRARNKGYAAIILDPLYKINEGDENSASEMARFFNHLDTICKQLNVSIICCHHHSKGSQGAKFAWDRSSGSGVFARDPDAILDMIQIDPRDVEMSLPEGQTAWRISYNLREFASPECTDVIFAHPLHSITYDLKDAEPLSGVGATVNSRRGNAVKAKNKESKVDRLKFFIENWEELRGPESRLPHPTIEDAAIYFEHDKGFSARTIRRWAEEDDELAIKNGFLFIEE